MAALPASSADIAIMGLQLVPTAARSERVNENLKLSHFSKDQLIRMVGSMSDIIGAQNRTIEALNTKLAMYNEKFADTKKFMMKNGQVLVTLMVSALVSCQI